MRVPCPREFSEMRRLLLAASRDAARDDLGEALATLSELRQASRKLGSCLIRELGA